MRAKFNAAPLETQTLAEDVTMLSGPGGAVVVLNGPDGKFVVDTFVAPAWPRLKVALDALGNAPVNYVIDTHWHFDHTDNNAHLHASGATVLAHENTMKRMSEPHDLPVLYRGPDGALAGLHFDPSPAEALPQQTFRTTYKLQANGESLTLQHVPPAHTDTDIYVHFEKANVIQMGDLFFKGCIPTSTPVRAAKSPARLPPPTKFCRWPTTTPRSLRGMARSAIKWTSRNFGTCWSLRAIALRN
jgi:glyoxylase-like metal-dependent hydrolase (beta-lactamase superfamily II)